MAPQTDERIDLRVKLQTVHGYSEGCLRMSAVLRMLDAINIEGRRFITLHPPTASEPGWLFDDTPVTINKDVVLFVVQIDEHDRPRAPGVDPTNYTRAGLRIRVKDYRIDGFMHVVRGGSPIERLSADRHRFVALTAASITGPGIDLVVPFVAVNREHITATQEIASEGLSTIEETSAHEPVTA